MTDFRFSRNSERHLSDVHPDLVKVVRLALRLSDIDFAVIEGRRTLERQRSLFNNGASRTLNSRHLTGHAVDLAPLLNGKIPWEDWQSFERVAQAMKSASVQLAVPVTWGGDWPNFRDGPHFELPRGRYP